jgi:tRNA 5-methylaminomethyl-2-thiouridine biosynthesis bifunctional protein
MNGMHTVSATYRKAEEGLGIRAEDNARNQQALAQMLDLDRDKIVLRQSQVGSRCNSPDRFPLVGPVPTFETMAHDFAELRRNARAKIDKTPHYQAGLFLNTAHGSNGMCSIPLCAEFLASLIEGESSPLDRSMMAALNPARFLIQDLKKQR